jgi:hypothetical protein
MQTKCSLENLYGRDLLEYLLEYVGMAGRVLFTFRVYHLKDLNVNLWLKN